MGWQGWFTTLVAATMVVLMARHVAGPDMILMVGLTLLLAVGIIDPSEALVGFSNPAVLTVAALFIIAGGVRDTGGLDFVLRRLLGRPALLASAQSRLMLPVSAMSAFINNTPVVAMMVPVVQDWARRIDMPPSRLLIPLSYAAILGGTCTLIGTSTNLVVAGLAIERLPSIHFGLFEIAWLGVPALLVGTLYVIVASRWLLPDRSTDAPRLGNPREYTVAMRVDRDSPIVGQTVEEAGLRHLPGLFLVEVERQGHVIPAVSPKERLLAGDQLLFVGIVDSVVDLRKIRGLVPATDQVQKLSGRPGRRLVEAVVSSRSVLVGRNIRETGFRSRFNAAIIAVHRQGERIRSKIGDITLRPGDTLLLEAHPTFMKVHRNDGTFALVSEVEGGAPPQHDKAWIAALILLAMILLHVALGVDLLVAALIAAGAMMLTGCLTGAEARRSLDLQVLITVAAAFGIGVAMERSGAAAALSQTLVDLALPFGPVGVLLALYVATGVLTELISNNAAAALMFPVVVAAAERAGMEIKPCLLVLMIAASASFSTPIGYQTNLMVYGPGRYRFADFARFGLPLQLALATVVITMATWLWL